jgi:hypothetical protein
MIKHYLLQVGAIWINAIEKRDQRNAQDRSQTCAEEPATEMSRNRAKYDTGINGHVKVSN